MNNAGDIKSIIEKYAKLNELTEAQLESVEAAVQEAVVEGIGIGYYNGGVDANKHLEQSYEDFHSLQMAIRTFFSGMSAVFIAVIIATYIHFENPVFLIALAAFTNTTLYYTVDGIASTVRKWLKNKRSKNESGTGSSSS